MIIEIQVITNASKEEVLQEKDYLKVKVHAKPIAGQANKTVVKLLSKHFNVSQNKIHIICGLKSRKKVVEILN
ncbi:MAG: DUF167 domain-containing protein [Candidatus Micrarchaeota archaeon]